MSGNSEKKNNNNIVQEGCGGEIVITYARSHDCGDYIEYDVELECLKCKKLFIRTNY